MWLNNDTHVLGLIKGHGHLIGIYVTFALNRCSNFVGQEAGESLVVSAAGLLVFQVGRKSHLSPACALFLCGETSGDKTFTQPDIFRISTSQQLMCALLKVMRRRV
jgi:NhaP-type Na+/H+ or K+/H+ antiporter